MKQTENEISINKINELDMLSVKVDGEKQKKNENNFNSFQCFHWDNSRRKRIPFF